MKTTSFFTIAVTVLVTALFAVSCASSGTASAGNGSSTAVAASSPSPSPANNAPKPPAGKNLAVGKVATTSGYTQLYSPDKAVDGDVNTYFEGTAKAYPNDLIVDLGSSTTVNGIVIKLNPRRIWSERTQTFEVFVSDDGKTFTSVAASKDYDFDPVANVNTVVVPFKAKAQFIKVQFTANTEAPGGQAAEFEVYGE